MGDVKLVLLGIERLREHDFDLLQGKRVGLMSNPSAIDRHFKSSYDIFRQSQKVNLKALFGPEHGFAAAAPDAASVDHAIDPQTGLPVFSLYGKGFRPSKEMLQDIDVLVCDIQDIGVRFYTYVWTISYILEACGEAGVEVIILDRPNPLGARIEGPALEAKFSSFVGRFNIPMQHGMSLGEMAQMINAEWNPTPAKLSVVPCYGWQHWMMWDDTGLSFVTTSPAIPNVGTSYHYPGSCLLEGIELSEGRGTALPFEVVGAPYIDGSKLAETLNQQNLSGVHFRPHAFMPTASKYAHETCYGIQAHIVDKRVYRPIQAWLAVILAIHQLYPDDFSWLALEQEHYERGAVHHFDRLIGSSKPRQLIEADAALEDIMEGWEQFCADFEQAREPYLLYR
jgi:beta-N-acetylhexosaminidase